MTLRSPVWPLCGIVLVWAWYGLSTTIEGARERRTAMPAASLAAPASKKGTTLPLRPRASESGTIDGSAGVPQTTATPAASVPAAVIPLSPDDEALLAALDGAETEEARIACLEDFVATHPDHALARALLVSALLGSEADAVEIRPHIEALLALVPDSGVPHLLLASLEIREGRGDLARRCLVQAATKDLAWSPDSELLQLSIRRERAAETPPLASMTSLLSVRISFCPFVRDLARQLLPRAPSETDDTAAVQPDLAMERAAARALFKTGTALQANGLSIIENLVGYAVMGQSAAVLRAAADFGPEDEESLARGETMYAVLRLLTEVSPRWEQELLASPDAVSRCVSDMAACGELRVMLRASMDRLGARNPPGGAETER